ncbi:MAG: type II toxin-antitoxin system HipA family toxin [Asticcacaulis sp.]|uniref:type II toxin-antitoxin system HipA family toxin n=1 Tax=Asticcacaulis sp. TaxID=1872648 RepID=UPI0039E4CDF2
MTQELVCLLNDHEMGRLYRRAGGKLVFTYAPAWREAEGAFPLSLSMPLAAAEHHGEVVEAFLWGLLPDNEHVLQRWATRFQVSPRNVFALISHVGEDCAGAIQFITPERVEAVRAGELDGVEWLTEQELAARLRALREDHAAWRLPRDHGQFSLAGAQPKTALLYAEGRWGVPSGRIPTTHILKPPTADFDGHAENEHLCLTLARHLGLPTAGTEVRRFGDEPAIVVERYDRVALGNDIIRLHQEDMCQALGIRPHNKYQNEGGPDAAKIIQLLRTQSTAPEEDVATFLDALALNWFIGGTDAHAKNYSLLIADGPQVRLAPLYDIGSILPYERVDLRRAKLSMKIGGEYYLLDIGLKQWRRFAQEARVDEGLLIARLRELARALPNTIAQVVSHGEASGLDHPILAGFSEKLTHRAGLCRDILEAD